MSVWLLRIAWVSLPFSAGPAAASALHDWSSGPQRVAAVLLWGAWAGVLLGLFAPRPAGLTTVRVVAPVFAVLAAVAALADDAAVVVSAGALAATVLTTALAGLPAVSIAAANGVAYGDERRFPLKTPPALFLGPLPLAPVLVGAGVAAGPLLVADDRPVVGAVALVIGLPTAAVMVRALHGLSRRWAVLVPAGIVLIDPLTLPDPVLFLRERIVSLRAVDPRAPVPSDAVDLRLGALADSLGMTLDREIDFLYTRRGVRGTEHAKGTEIRFATVAARRLLAVAAERRIRVAR